LDSGSQTTEQLKKSKELTNKVVKTLIDSTANAGSGTSFLGAVEVFGSLTSNLQNVESDTNDDIVSYVG